MKFAQAVAFSVLALCGCNRTVDCSDSTVDPVFTGYSLADIDTLVLRKYKAGSGFNSLIDTFLVTRENATYTGNGVYDVFIHAGVYGTNGLQSGSIQVGYDWQLYIPAVNKTVAITGITSEHRSTRCWKCGCLNSIFSYYADTLVYRPAGSGDYTFPISR